MTRSALCVLFFIGFGCSSGALPETPSSGSISSRLYESDDSNCGAEGYACVNGRTCSASVCIPAYQVIEDDGAPSPRGWASAGFIDGKYAVFGGCDSTIGSVAALDTSAFYDPDMDSWSSGPDLTTARAQAMSVTTDNGIFTYGGLPLCQNGSNALGNAEWMFHDSDWVPDPIPNDLGGRYNSIATWTGTDIYLFGGASSIANNIPLGSSISLGSGWIDRSCSLEDCGRAGGFAGFFEKDVIHYWGGTGDSDPTPLVYNILNKSWYQWVAPVGTPDFQSLSPDGNTVRSADDTRRIYYPTQTDLYIYDRETQSWTTDTTTPPMGFCSEGATAWTGSEVITWSGHCDSSLSSVGVRYQPPAPAAL